jgi:uncharacterized protein YegP (UPF0339 family)
MCPVRVSPRYDDLRAYGSFSVAGAEARSGSKVDLGAARALNDLCCRSRGRVRDFRWKAVAENGGIVADSAEGYRHQGYAITMAKKLNPGAQLVVDNKSEG